MTTGLPAHGARRLVERLRTLGIEADQVVTTAARRQARFGGVDLEPASYLPEFGPLTHRLERLLGGGRGLAVYVTGGRTDVGARQQAALQLGLGLAPGGLTVVIVDCEFLRPGLGGLLDEPWSEGVLDMARFGRSPRSLLLRPVPEGPWVLPAGSLPVDDPVPLGPEALRSALYRLSRVCDVALVVGPLAVRQDRHPLVRLCDHVVYALEADGDAANEAGAGAVSELRAQGAHVLGVVVATPPEPPRTETTAGSAAAARPAWTFDFGDEMRRAGLPEPEAEPGTGWAEKPVPPAAPARREAPQAAPPGDEPAPRAGVQLPNLGLPELGEPVREEPGRARRTEAPPRREDKERGQRELAAAVATRRSSEEAQSVARDLDLGGRDFDFESERGSRWPLVGWIVLALALIWFLVGVGPKILDRWRAEESPDDMLASERNREAETVPSTSPPAPATVEPAPATGTEGVPPPATEGPAPAPTESPSTPASGPPMQPVEGKPATSPGALNPPSPATGESKPPPAPETVESKTPAPSAPAAAANMVWSVHVASYETEKQAQVEIESLRRRGFEGRAVETDLGGKGIWFRVYVGAYATQAEALTVRDALLRLPEYDFAQVRRVPR